MLSLPDFREKSVVICFAREGQRVSFKNDNLIIQDSEKKVVLQKSCHRIFSLWIIGQTTLTSGIIERSRKFGFSILLLSYGSRLYGMFNVATEGNFLLRRRQYGYAGLEVAKLLVDNKIRNQAAILRSVRGKTPEVKEAIRKLGSYREMLGETTELKEVLGTEGIASRVYFREWFGGMEWRGRKPRAKLDPINTVLDIGYTYLFYFLEALLNLYGFDVYQGVYHRSFYQRKSLVCDLVEPFRCVIDYQVRKAFNLGQFKVEDFRHERGQFLLDWEQSKGYTTWIMKAILDHKEVLFTYVQEYYRCFIRGKPWEEYPVFDFKP